MLIGQYNAKIGQKGRLALPKRFREELGERVVLARWYENCLVIVDYKVWGEILKDFTKGSAVTRPARDTARFLLGSAFEIELDQQGRFVIPQVLRDYALLTNEVIFAGLGDKVEIWDKGLWKEHENNILAKAAEFAESLAQKERGEI